jgi:hypothetical protein
MTPPAKDPAKQKGAIARSKALSPAAKSAIAKKAAVARWGEKPLIATHKGNFNDELGIDVECYVLDDAKKTPVISQRGMGKALGLSERGNAFPRFIASQAMQETLGAGLLEKLANPLKFQWVMGGAQPSTIHNGSEAELLIDVCQAVIKADAAGKLKKAQKPVAISAAIILSASAKSGIEGLVYALSGYDRTKEEVVQAFKAFVQEEARKYEKEFPPELYAEWYRLYEIPKPERGRPWGFKHLTLNHVYWPLAKSDGKLLELLRVARSNNGESGKKLFSFLNEVGTRALRMHLGRILEMAESSSSKDEYLRKIVDRFGGQQEMDLSGTEK